METASSSPHNAPPPGAQRWAFWSPKPGAGTTTVATSVAALLASPATRRRVVLIELGASDADLHLCTQPPPPRLDDLVAAAGRLDQSLLDSLVPPLRPGLQVLSLPTEGMPQGAELKILVDRIAALCDVLLLDLGSGTQALQVWPHWPCDRAWMVCHPDLPSLRRLHLQLPEWQEMLTGSPQAPVLHVVASAVRPSDQALEIEELKRLLQPMACLPGLQMLPLRSVPAVPQAAQAALLGGVTLLEQESAQPWTRDLTQEVTGTGVGSLRPHQLGTAGRLWTNWKDRLWTRWQTA